MKKSSRSSRRRQGILFFLFVVFSFLLVLSPAASCREPDRHNGGEVPGDPTDGERRMEGISSGGGFIESVQIVSDGFIQENIKIGCYETVAVIEVHIIMNFYPVHIVINPQFIRDMYEFQSN